MNTEKLEKLKKSLDNKFIPDNMKDKIRAEIKKLEADIKTDETITTTEVKEEVKEIEKKVEKALEVAEEIEEKAEAKKEEAEAKEEAKAEEKKEKETETKKPKSTKKSVFSVAKEIRKDNESWEDAKERARKIMKSETTETKKKTRTETDKLLAMVRRNKEYKKLAGTSNLAKDATRRALPRGKRISENGNVYYENRANRVDVGGFRGSVYLAGGGYADKGVYVETLDEEIDLTDDGVVRARKTQEGKNLSFGELREKHGGTPEALAFDYGGKVGRYSILGEVDGEQPVLYATTDDKERIKPLLNMAEIDLYELTGKNHRIFVTDEVTDDEVYNYGNGGRTRERRYVNHSEDYEVRYSKNKPHRRGYGYEEGGSLEDNNFKRFMNAQISYIISLKTVSEKREPIQNLLDNMEDYRSGSEIVKRITTDNLKYALQQKTVSKINEVLRISLNALQYAEGGTIIGTPETPLARGLDIDYTGLVGETGAMSEGEMFAEGGSIENQYEGKTPSQIWGMLSISQKYHFLEDHSKEIESTPMSIEKATKTAYKFLPTKIKISFEHHIRTGQYAKGGYTNERRHVNKAQDYEVYYAKNKPNRTGYLGKRSFDDGGVSNGRYEVVKVIGFDKNGKTLPKNEIKVIADFDSRKEALNFVYEQQFKKDVTQRDIFIRDTKTNKNFAEGGYMTDPNFGDFQNGVYATGGVTKNYINRNQLNTITIKKGDKKLTYKVSDVYNGAYKLEDGGNLEKTAFYVSRRNVVKVQLKNGKDVKVANGYWIKKGAKPIHTSKYDDGGEIKMVDSKMSGGGSTKRGGAMVLAKQIRKDGESWQSALKRANEQLKK